eukprot:gene11194-13032_t
MNSTRYLINCCPYEDFNGEFVLRESAFVHSSNPRVMLGYDDAKKIWFMSSEKTMYCRAASPAVDPSQTMWEYWKSSTGQYVITKKMTITKIILPEEKEEPPPPPAQVNASPSTQRADLARQNSESKVSDVMNLAKCPTLVSDGGKVANLCTYEIASSDPTQPIRHMVGPLSHATSFNRSIIDTASITAWPAVEPLWSWAVENLDHEYTSTQHRISDVKCSIKDLNEEKAHLEQLLYTLTADLSTIKDRERAAQAKSDVLISRVGKNHIKRDWQQTKVNSGFPAGDDIRTLFTKDFLDFESFACDAENCLEELNYGSKSKHVLVHKILRFVHLATEQEVNARLQSKRDYLQQEFGISAPDAESQDTLSRLFWYHTLQSSMYQEILSLQSFPSVSVEATALHARMLDATNEQMIEGGEGRLRIPQLVLMMLKFHTIAALSDPRCYLYPIPGTRIRYWEGYTVEILSPGTKKYGRIEENDEVEVVFCWLYFEPPPTVTEAGVNIASVKPVQPCLVRRLTADEK